MSELFFGAKREQGQGEPKKDPSPTPPPAPPHDEPQPVPPGTNPSLMIELVSGSHINVHAIWPQGGDVNDFGQLLAMLVTGNLIGPLSAAVAITGNRNKEPEKAAAIHELMMKVAPRQKKDTRPDRPVVLPSEAVRYNMRPYRV